MPLNFNKMKAVKKEINEKGHIILTCEDSVLFGLLKIQTKFIATKEYPKGYWNWRKLPNKTLVSDTMSFQLDSWCKDFD
jgi:hypothetical protein